MRILRVLRQQRGYTQEQLGKLCGVPAQRICDYETGRRQPPPEVAALLAEKLSCPLASNFPVPPKLRPFVGAPGSEIVQVDEAPSWASCRTDTYRDARARLDPAALPSRAFRETMRIDGDVEGIAWHTLCAAGAQPCAVSPVVCGFGEHLVVDPAGVGLRLRSKAALFLDYGRWDALVLPQISLRVGSDIIRVDGLAWLDVTRNGPWLVLEFDGAPHHAREWDKIRDARLGMPVLRFPNSCILSPGFEETVKSRLFAVLGATNRKAG
jgi:transcriptional regulator with XRE-family HTH domain